MKIRLTDRQWQKILAFLKTCPNIYTGQEQECRQFLEAVLWVARSGGQWKLLPAEYGNWRAIYKRFARWSAKGIFKKLFEFCASDSALEHLFIDSTIVGVRASTANARKGIPFSVEEVKKRIENGERVSTLAAELQVDAAAIYYRLRKDKFVLPGSVKNSISRKTLEDLYEEKKMAVGEIQKLTGHSVKKITNALARYGLTKRIAPAAGAGSKHRQGKDKFAIDRNTLADLYIHQNKPVHELAVYFNCSEMTVNRYLKKYGIRKIKRSAGLLIDQTSEDKERQSILRVISLVNSAKAVKYPSAAALAERFGVTEQTIENDIAFAREILRVPLKFSEERKGYFVDEHYSFDEIIN
jgi:transposase